MANHTLLLLSQDNAEYQALLKQAYLLPARADQCGPGKRARNSDRTR